MPMKGKTATFPIADHPELAEVEDGQQVEGTWKGTVQSNDGENAVVLYDELTIAAANMADKALNKMTGKKSQMPAPAAPAMEEEEAY